jgi:hypothetical protein
MYYMNGDNLTVKFDTPDVSRDAQWLYPNTNFYS